METAGLIYQPVTGFSGAGLDSRRFVGIGNSGVSSRPRSCTRILSHEFSDSGHVLYYESPARCVGKKEKGAEIKAEKKKKEKLIKRLSKDLASFSVGEVNGNSMFSEATEVLLAELQHLRSQEKEQRRIRKEEEKAKRKAALVSGKMQSDSESSSSSSSESSDSGDCGKVIDMISLRGNGRNTCVEIEPEHAIQEDIQNKCIEIEPEPVIQEDTKLASIASPAQEEQMRILGETTNLSPEICREGFRHGTDNECSRSSNNCNGSTSIAVAALGRRIEVCMGGKCKKMGAPALMEEFERKAGVEVAVVGCKCMGKCKNAPNVRVTAESFEEPPVNPLYIGVGLEDVGTIVAELLGKCGTDRYLMAPSLVN